MDIYNKMETVDDLTNPLPAESNINVVLDVPWLRVQHLLQESDSVINSRSLNQSRRASTEDSDSDSKICQNCHSRIRELEAKLAEIQQQLTVAISSNFTKNVMIEQLDKTLSKIVEGWKKLESEKISQIKKLEEEKNMAQEDLKREQEVIIKIERELTLTLDKLMLSQKEIEAIHNEKQSWKAEYDSKISKLMNELTLAQNRNSTLIASNKTLIDDYENKLHEVNNKFSVSIQEWELHEDKYQTELNNNHLNLNALKQEQIQNKQTIKTLQLQLQLLSNQLEDLLREKESLKVEVSILQARNVAAKSEMDEREKMTIESMRKENENQLLDLEKMINAQYDKKMSELEIRYQKSLNEKLYEKAADVEKQRLLLEQQYEKALQEHVDRYDQQLRMREEELKRQFRSKDDQIQDLMVQIQHLQHENECLASGRSHLMSRIQALLENQWQESLKVLYGNSDLNQPTLNLNFTTFPQHFLSQNNLSKEWGHFPTCESPTTDYQSANLKKLHVCKTKVQKSQSQSHLSSSLNRSTESSNLLQDNQMRMCFKALPNKPKIHLCSANYNKEHGLPFDQFDSAVKSVQQKFDLSENNSEFGSNDQFARNETDLKQTNESESRCRSSFASRIDLTESLCECQNELQAKMVRKTQSLLERIPTPDEYSKMTDCSLSFPMSEIFSETEKRYNKSQKHRFRSGADKSLNESINRYEERQLELKKYLERLLQRPPGEPIDASKDLWPCKDENNFQINKNGGQPEQNKLKHRFEVPSLNLHDE